MPLQPLYLESDSLRIGANQFLTQSNAVYVGNNLHVGNTLIFGAIGGGANDQWTVPAYSNNKIIISANNNTPLWGAGAIDLRVGTGGGRVGITFSSNSNAGSDHGYIYFYDNVGGYTAGAGGGESALLLIGVQNDAADDTVAIEGPGNIFINPGMGVDQRAGITSWSNTSGNLWVGNNSIKYLSIHEGLQAPFTLRAPITFANSANALVFSGASNTNITLRTSPNGIISFDGGAGSLLSISNNILGQIFSVNDISGFPVLEVTANTLPSNTMIQMGQFGSKVTIGTNVTPNSSLTVTGNSTVTAIDIQHAASPQNLGYLRTPSGTKFTYAGSDQLVIMQLAQLRFTDGTAYNYDTWGGLRWVSANNTMIIGGPGAPGITNNAVVSSNVVIHNATTGNFMVANTAATNLFVGANGNVGIGNSTPTSRLVAGGFSAALGRSNTTYGTYYDSEGITVSQANNTVGNFSYLDFRAAGGNAVAALIIINEAHTGSAATGSLTFATASASAVPSERMRIAANGNVGIANSAPAFPLSVTGAINANSYNVSGTAFINANRTITYYGTTHNVLGSGSGTRDINLTLGNFVSATVAGATTWTFSNPIAGSAVTGFILELTNGGSAALTWPASVKWPGGTVPTFTAAGIDVLTFFTDDGGTTYRGVLSMLDSK